MSCQVNKNIWKLEFLLESRYLLVVYLYKAVEIYYLGIEIGSNLYQVYKISNLWDKCFLLELY